MDGDGVAASTDDERLSAMSALAQLITHIDLARTSADVRVEAERWAAGSQGLAVKLTPVTIHFWHFRACRDEVVSGEAS